LAGLSKNLADIEAALNTYQPDMIISDVQFGNEQTIFDVLSKTFEIPIIFVTAIPEVKYQKAAQQYNNAYFLVKPFHALTLKALLEQIQNKLEDAKKEMLKGLKVIDQFRQKKILPFERIKYILSEGNYLFIFTKDKKYTMKSSLGIIMEELNSDFIQVQRSYIINKQHIQRIDYSRNIVYLEDISIPIGRTYKANLSDIN
jgi:DNA-binding LytR/AlgR family response regulator